MMAYSHEARRLVAEIGACLTKIRQRRVRASLFAARNRG
jgi:hypothetical protein